MTPPNRSQKLIRRSKARCARNSRLKLFVYIKDPNELIRVSENEVCLRRDVGTTDVVLVLSEKEKSAMRLPFAVDANDNLLPIKNTLGEECVVLSDS